MPGSFSTNDGTTVKGSLSEPEQVANICREADGNTLAALDAALLLATPAAGHADAARQMRELTRQMAVAAQGFRDLP